MELSALLLLALAAGFLLFFIIQSQPKTHGHLPPGPRPLPFLGNLLQMDRRGLLNSFLQLQEKYGDVFTVHLGPRPVVMLCSTDTIREALVDQAEAFSGRGTVAVLDPVIQGYGVAFANGECWKTIRRFSLTTMRDFGMGKRSVEEQIKEEAQCLVEELKKYKGAPLNPTFFFQSIAANIICSIVFGERFDYTDHQFLRLMDLIYQTFSLMSSLSSQVFELFPAVLKYFPGGHRQISQNLQEILDYIGYSVEQHRATLDPSAPRDFIDTFLLRMEKEKSNRHTEFHHQNLMMSVLSLFFAGTETTSTTLRYSFLIMLKYPNVAEKVQKEIDQVIGSHRLPTLDDRSKMPYTDAVIHEIQRFSDLAPIGLPHRVTKDTLFRGYLIPKNTEVYPILSSALHDPRYFEQPDTFNPEHFLDANGALKKSEAFLPFSAGKRICLGEGIARNELFLFFTTILQNFSLASPVALENIDLTSKTSGSGKIPPPYQIHFLSR
ncbi:cytochrome P450 2B19 [Arvicanthis niloticus]|uniref:cytochrome P450 2B19 n=1 Tax=Arvicanthis niloticus TaxID=61156 RepID=UPI001486F380|nr:cytochrome P450 2B19 [Arvicanthis niloticus]